MTALQQTPRCTSRQPNSLVTHVYKKSDDLDRCERQRRLTERYLEAFKGQVLDLFELFRKTVDENLLRSFPDEEWEQACMPGAMQVGDYPEGWCGEISDGIMDELIQFFQRSQSHLAEQLRTFHQEGGIIRQLYGIITTSGNKTYFQNCFQMGSWIVDGAGDSGTDRQAKKVYIQSFDEFSYRNIENFHDFYAVARSYWGARLIPTAPYFPYLAPFCPAMQVLPNGHISFLIPDTLFYKNIAHGLRLSRYFLEEHQFTGYRLPPGCIHFFRHVTRELQNSVLHFEENNHHTRPYHDFWRHKLLAECTSKHDTERARERVEFLKILRKNLKALGKACPPVRGIHSWREDYENL